MLQQRPRLKGMGMALVSSRQRLSRWAWQLKLSSILLSTIPRAPLTHSITSLLFHRIFDRSTQTSSTLSSPLESSTESSFRKQQEQLMGTMVQKVWARICWNGFFCQPLNSSWLRNCLENSFLLAMSMISLGQTMMALSISTLGSSSTKESSVGSTSAFSQCSSVKSSRLLIWFSCTSNSLSFLDQLSFLGSLSSCILARATEQQKLGRRQRLWCLLPMQELKYLVNCRRQEYCLPEMALQSMERRQAVGSLTLILSRNLLYSRALRKHPFLPRMSMNLKMDMKKLVDIQSQTIYFLRKGSLKNSARSYPPAISQMQITRWIRLSASRQLPCSRRNSPTAYMLSTCSGFIWLNSNSAFTSFEFFIISYSFCSDAYFLLASKRTALSSRRMPNFSRIWKNYPTPGDSTDFFIIFFRCFCIFCSRLLRSGSPSSFSGYHPRKCRRNSLSQLNLPQLISSTQAHSSLSFSLLSRLSDPRFSYLRVYSTSFTSLSSSSSSFLSLFLFFRFLFFFFFSALISATSSAYCSLGV